MTNKHRIVVSTENSAYQGWQAKLFYYSCVTRLGHQPIFIVHEKGERWHPDFYDLVRAGATVRGAPSYILPNGIAPRNTAGTLLHAAPLLRPDEFIVLCDPDMIFVRQPEFPQELSANYYSYMRCQREPVEAAAAQFGIGPQVLKRLESRLCVGVPYVIPAVDAVPLAELWLRVFDTFSPEGRQWDDIWQDIMYAFGIAALKLGWKINVQDQVDLDQPGAIVRRPIIHYCMGEGRWCKRDYFPHDKVHKVWDPPFDPEAGSVLAEVFSQIRQAREFYRNLYFGDGAGKARGLGPKKIKST